MGKLSKVLGASLGVLTLAATTSADAQAQDRMARPPVSARPGELVLFSGANYSGRTYYVTGARTNIDAPFTPQSLMTAAGEQWRLCSGYSNRPPCVTASGGYGAIARLGIWNVRSAQPLGGARPPGGEFSGTGDAGPSLRGMASEFFRSPRDRGQRVPACRTATATAACAADTAARWCRARGYSGSAHQLLETVGRSVFLADVLCQRRAG